jgi:hypothetical protein
MRPDRPLAAACAVASVLALSSPLHADDHVLGHELPLDVHSWRLVERESGPNNYFSVVADPAVPGGAFIRSKYEPGFETAVFGAQIPDNARESARYLRWRWRAEALPTQGSECGHGFGDSAASVYVMWKRGLRWYTLKYVWSTVDPVGSVCHRVRNPLVAQDTVVTESGPPLDRWVTETIDLVGDFRRYFEKGDPTADVPDFVGVGVMSDGDQSRSPSAADFADFAVTLK